LTNALNNRRMKLVFVLGYCYCRYAVAYYIGFLQLKLVSFIY
jgi:hypothetical protein